MENIAHYLSPHLIIDVSAQSKEGVLSELCDLLAQSPDILDPGKFLKAIINREKIMSTGIGMGIAIPHARTPAVKDFVMAIGRCRKGVDFESLDGLPVHIVILMGSPERKRDEFLSLMAKIGPLFNRPDFKERFLDAESPEEMYRFIIEK